MSDYFNIKQNLEKGKYAPVYVLDGEEPYYIDNLLHVFEEKILGPDEKDFNLITLYGKETTWADVVNAARRFPMFAERMVVILKEAAQLKDIGELANYIENPSPTTILVVDHRLKEIDKRTRFAKVIKDKAVYFTSKKLKEDETPSWISSFAQSQGYEIPAREAEMLSVYLGNDLQKIANELEKIRINEPELKQLTTQHIEKYIGISKEYNVFDLPDVIFRNDNNKLARMMAYFTANPKSAPMVLVIGTLYGYLNKVFLCFYSQPNFANDRKSGIWSHHRQAAQRFNLSTVHRCIALLEEFSHKAVGIGNNNGDTAMLRELTGKLNKILYNR
jgi:DNA polymerase-3 subunit delta